MIDISKLKGLSAIKKSGSNKNTNSKRNTSNNKKAPHANMCEVLFYANKFYALIGNERYPLEITQEDYINAQYAFSTPNNPNWDWYTLRKFKADENNIVDLMNFWQLVYPKQKTYVNVVDGIAKLCMERVNAKNERAYNKLSPKYYADRKN